MIVQVAGREHRIAGLSIVRKRENAVEITLSDMRKPRKDQGVQRSYLWKPPPVAVDHGYSGWVRDDDMIGAGPNNGTIFIMKFFELVSTLARPQ